MGVSGEGGGDRQATFLHWTAIHNLCRAITNQINQFTQETKHIITMLHVHSLVPSPHSTACLQYNVKKAVEWRLGTRLVVYMYVYMIPQPHWLSKDFFPHPSLPYSATGVWKAEECDTYSGTPLLWTPWGPGEVSCIQWNPSIVDTLGTW